MNTLKKKTRKKVTPRIRTAKNNNKILLLVIVLLISFVSIFVIVNQIQQHQALRQYASSATESGTQTSQITQPIWGCIGLGSQECISNNTFVSDPQNGLKCLVLEKAAVEPSQVEWGQMLIGTVVLKNMCSAGVHVPQLFIKAQHSSGKIIAFAKKSTPQAIIKDQTLTFTTDHTVAQNELTGAWNATLLTNGTNNSEVAFASQSSQMKFTVIEPCNGIAVSKELKLDKTKVKVGESISGTMTYKNPCNIAFAVKNILIQVKKPGPGNSTTVEDFMPGLGNITFASQQEQIVQGTMTIPNNPCEDNKPTCEWAAFGAYQKTDTGGFVLDSKAVMFTVDNVSSASASPSPSASASASPGPSASVSAVPSSSPTTPAISPSVEPKPPTKLDKKTVYFDFDSSVLKPETITVLDSIAEFMKTNTTTKVYLGGHTDSVGTEEYNIGLGTRRAEAVKGYIVGKGIAADRFTLESHGELVPIASNVTPEGRAINRRVEIFTP